MNLIKRLKNNQFIQNIFIVSILDILAKVAVIISTILMIRFLSKDDYSQFVLFQSISLFFVGSITGGLNISYIRFASESYSRNKSGISGLYTFNIKIILVIYLIIIALIFLGKNIFNINIFNSNEILVFSIIYSFTYSLIIIGQGYYQSTENFRKSGMINNINNLLILIFILFIASISVLNIFKVSIIYISISIILSLYLTVSIFKQNSGTMRDDNHITKEYLRVSGWLILYNIFLGVLGQLNVFMISSFLSKDDVANYGVGFKYYNVLLTVLPSILAVIRVRTSKVDMVDSTKNQRGFTVNWIKKVSPLMLVFLIITIPTSYFILPILNGPNYNASIPVFQILCIGVALSYIFAPNVSVLMSLKKYKLMSLIGLGALIINFVGNIILLNHVGIIGASIITVISQAFINITSTIFVLHFTSKESTLSNM